MEPAVESPLAARTMPQLVRAAAAAYGGAVAVRAVGGDGTAPGPVDEISYTTLDRESALIARGLLARGIGKGSRVGVIAGNGPDFVVWLAAIARIGAIMVPISTMIRANELVRVLRQSDVAGLIVQRHFLGYDYVQRLGEALPALIERPDPDLRLPRAPYLRWIVATGTEELPPAIRPLAWLTQAADQFAEALLAEVEAEVHPTDQLIEIYTSGSMALPKGVRHNHGPVLFRAHFVRDMLGATFGQETTALLPMFWVGGLMMYLMPSLTAGAVTLCPERLLNNSRMAMGSVLSDEDLALMARAPRPWWGLGMSETLGPYSWGDDFRAPGYPVCAPMDHFAPGYEIRVADENDQPVAAGEIGEMQVRGYPVSPGLHKIEREGNYTADGYYRTGDMCKVEQRPEAGPGARRVHFVGRDGDMIKTASANVSPAEVEMEMQALPGVHSAYVVGLPDAERGQLLVAAVVPRDGATLDFAEIEATLRRNLSGYKVPRFYTQIAREDVPLLPSNKVARRQIAAMMAAKMGRPVPA